MTAKLINFFRIIMFVFKEPFRILNDFKNNHGI